MPYLVTSKKFFNQLVNGTDFTSNSGVYDTFPKANTPELIKAVFKVQYSWRSDASASDVFDINNNAITRQYGSFKDDGFIEGDIIDVIDGSIIAADRTISLVTDTLLIFGGAIIANTNSANMVVRGKTALRGFKLSYNLVENTSAKDFASLQDGSFTAWSAEDVGTGSVGARSTSLVDGEWNSNAVTSKTGSFKIRFVQDVDAYTQELEFEHVFRVIPYFLDNERAQFASGSNVSYLENNLSYKYVFDLKGGVTSQNPNEIKIVEEENTLGNVGGFDETFNGGLPNFAMESIDYADGTTGLPVDGIQGDRTTDVTIIINSPTGIGMNYNHACMVYISRLSADTDIDPLEDFETNWLFDSLRQVRGATTVSSTAIKLLSVNSYSGGTKLQIIFTCDFTTAQKNLMTNGDEFAVMVAVDDLNNLGIYRTTTKDDTLIVIDEDVPDLYAVDSFGFYRRDMIAGTDTPFTNYVGFDEDTVLLEFIYWLDISLEAKMQKMRFKLVAFDTATEDYFVINQDEIDLSNSVLSGDTQQVNLTKYQPFILPTSNNFKKITVANNSTSGSKEYYKVRYPFKLGWMDYKQLTTADGVFYDAAETTNFFGLNQKVSNYSGVNGYELMMIIEADVLESVGGITTTYADRTPYIESREYEDDQPNNAFSSLVIEVMTTGGVLLPDDKLVKDRDNLIRATFTFVTPISALAVIKGEMKAETYRAGGFSSMASINNFETTPSNSVLQPLSGQTNLKVTNNGTTVVMECIVPENVALNIPDNAVNLFSARIMNDVSVLVDGKLTEEGLLKQKEDGVYKYVE
jgi:hypothetical protein